MKILILGTGHIGSVIAKDLAKNMPSAKIVMADKDLNRVEEAASKTGMKNISAIQLDIFDHSRLVDTLKGFDLAVGARRWAPLHPQAFPLTGESWFREEPA